MYLVFLINGYIFLTFCLLFLCETLLWYFLMLQERYFCVPRRKVYRQVWLPKEIITMRYKKCSAGITVIKTIKYLIYNEVPKSVLQSLLFLKQ